MTKSTWISAIASVAMLIAGCQAQQGSSRTTASGSTDSTAVAAPAKGNAAAPADAPEVKMSGDLQSGKLYIPTGDAASSALLLESSVPSEVQANKPFGFEIKVTNISKLKLESVEVSQTVPGTLKIKDATEGTPDGKANTLTYSAGVLGAGESKIFRLQGTATQSGALPMCLSARYNTSLCIASNVVSPALKVVTTGPAEALKCETLAYKFQVVNSGSGSAKNVRVETVLPDGLVTTEGKASLNFDAGNLGAGETKDFAFNAKASKAGAYEVKATAKADENLLSEPAVTKTAVKEPVLVLSKTGPEKAFIGQPIPYDIVVTNKGDGVAKNVNLYDSMPKGVPVTTQTDGGKADSTGKIRWNIGDLAPGASKKVTVVITFDQAGELRSAASVTGDCVENAAPVMVATTLTGIPAILMEVIDDPDPVRVNDKTTYTITVTNQGTAASTNVKLKATLEDPMDFISATGDTKDSIDGKVITFNPIPALQPKAKATFKVTVRANKAGDVRFKTEMTSDQLTRPVEQSEATNFYGQ